MVHYAQTFILQQKCDTTQKISLLILTDTTYRLLIFMSYRYFRFSSTVT